MQLLDSYWPANILAGLNFWAQENRLVLPDSVCTISSGPVGHETTQNYAFVIFKRDNKQDTGITRKTNVQLKSKKTKKTVLNYMGYSM